MRFFFAALAFAGAISAANAAVSSSCNTKGSIQQQLLPLIYEAQDANAAVASGEDPSRAMEARAKGELILRLLDRWERAPEDPRGCWRLK
jgi:hypothetical protein